MAKKESTTKGKGKGKGTSDKKIFVNVAGDNPHASRGPEGFLITNIKVGFDDVGGIDAAGEAYDGQKAEVYWPRPLAQEHTIDTLRDEVAALWGGNLDPQDDALQLLIDAGIRQLMTRPSYRMNADDEANADFAARQKYAQEAADNYSMGRAAAAGDNIKTKAKRADRYEAEAAELGMTTEELVAFVRTQKGLT